MSQHDDGPLPALPGRLERGADGGRSGAGALALRNHGAGSQREGGDAAHVTPREQGVAHRPVGIVHRHEGQAHPGRITAQPVHQVGLVRPAEGSEVHVPGATTPSRAGWNGLSPVVDRCAAALLILGLLTPA